MIFAMNFTDHFLSTTWDYFQKCLSNGIKELLVKNIDFLSLVLLGLVCIHMLISFLIPFRNYILIASILLIVLKIFNEKIDNSISSIKIFLSSLLASFKLHDEWEFVNKDDDDDDMNKLEVVNKDDEWEFVNKDDDDDDMNKLEVVNKDDEWEFVNKDELVLEKKVVTGTSNGHIIKLYIDN